MEELFITPLQPWSLGEVSGSEKTIKGEEGIVAFKSVFEDRKSVV